ncbi:hypothetical protein J5X98_05525 [Leptothermofonsia sichuanensis E412]|uniref:hypothetical protein n=1 Tax=Leptothermofonsia sichuanensis TaxID=2917832 RepID=UPI001CA711D2|nr:hypothetical protein [Leptothermofonsia sichuanensis]QZZ21891.1 hypothetical protein J5X98_05525 [Leptothermofonsia sichuanensis E412]
MLIQRLKSLKVAAILLAVVSIPATPLVAYQTSNVVPLASTSRRSQTPLQPLPAENIPQADGYYSRKAARDLQRAQEKAFSIQYLASQANSEPAADFVRLAQQTLNQAERSYQAGQFFAAEKQAKAANALYKAAETLYEGQLGYAIGRHGSKKASKRWYEAPYRAQERIARVEAAIAYYQVNPATATKLLQQARQLTQSAQNAAPLASLANYRASEHLANAALHLIEAQRGL